MSNFSVKIVTFSSKRQQIFFQKSLNFSAKFVKFFSKNYQLFIEKSSTFSYENRQHFLTKIVNIFLQKSSLFPLKALNFLLKISKIFPQKTSNFPAKINNFSYKNCEIFLKDRQFSCKNCQVFLQKNRSPKKSIIIDNKNSLLIISKELVIDYNWNIWHAYKKVSGRICLSPPEEKPEGSKHWNGWQIMMYKNRKLHSLSDWTLGKILIIWKNASNKRC